MSYELKLEKFSPFEFLTSPGLLREKSVLVLFTTRKRGISRPPFESLNLAFYVGDDEKSVIANRKKLFSELDIPLDDLVTAEQVHGNGIAVIGPEMKAGATKGPNRLIPETDALITREPKVPLAVLTADCLPLILVEPDKKAVAAIHSGWKGMELRLISSVVLKLTSGLDVEPGMLLAFIGPVIGSCCYQVNRKRARLFEGIENAVRQEEGRHYLDLSAITRWELQGAGLETKNIFEAGMCTSCLSNRFFSYRRQPVTGRQAALVMID